MNAGTPSVCCEPDAGEIVPLVGQCPRCGSRGKRVDSITLKAMLSVSLMDVQEGPYYFCRDTDCAVVYFSADGSQIFPTSMLRERVYQKESGRDDVWVCYCFHHTRASLRAELLATGGSTAIHMIETGIAAGQCACDLRNPQGSCCLGNVRALVQTLKPSLLDPSG